MDEYDEFISKFPRAKHDVCNNEIYLETFVCHTTLKFDVRKLVETVRITEWVEVKKKRGRKPKNAPPDPNEHIKPGSIISVEFKKKKGAKHRAKITGPFDNTVCIDMIMKNRSGGNKKVSIKVPATGNIDVTGCSHASQVAFCLYKLFTHLTPDVYSLKPGFDEYIINIVSYMKNVQFNLGFKIDQSLMTTYINQNPDMMFTASYFPCSNYRGAVIKHDSEQDENNESYQLKVAYNEATEKHEWKYKLVKLPYIIDFVKQTTGKVGKFYDREHTFMAFNSGVIIQTGMYIGDMERVNKMLFGFLMKCKDKIKIE